MANFPTVNYLDAASFAETIENPSMTPAKMEGGYVITRPRFTRRPRRTFSFVFIMMDDDNKATLENFWNTMLGGSNSFHWVHPVSGENLTVRFSDQMTMKFNRTGFGSVNIWQTDPVILVEV